MRRPRPAWLLAWALMASWFAAPDDIHVMSLVREGQVLVSFTVNNGFTEQIRESIRSGLPTSISYQVELRRSQPIWFDATLASATVTAGVRYDNLTRLHQLSRTIDGRGEEPRVTDNPEVVRAWLTEFKSLPLFSTRGLEPNGEYYVQVRARTHPRFAWFLWPWDRGWATGQAKFTFIQ
jgi:hypothetical protein